ncbi:MAG: lysophospholipid acyltransferase family protein [Candidatus Margulisiibacteriota bacterium]
MNSIFYHGWYWLVTFICVTGHFFLGLFCIFTPNFFKYNRKFARLCIKIIAKSMRLNVEAHGLDRIPKNHACIFMANHSSLIDIVVMTIAIPYHFNFIAKKELFWVPFIGLQMLFGGDFLINRSDPRQAKKCLNKVQKRLRKGWNMLIFPEGTRSSDGQILDFKRGAFKLAFDSNATIIPCYIEGSGDIVQKKSLKASPGTVKIHFDYPIPTKELSKDKAQMMQILQFTRNKIKSLKLTAETSPPLN